MNRETLIELQKEHAQEFEERIAQAKREEQLYRESEAFEKDAHAAYERLWMRKAKKEGWSYTPQPFVSAADRARMAEQEKQEKIAYLKEQLKSLEEN